MEHTEILDRLNHALAGRYHIQRELGHGGMGTVYLALDVKHDRQVALKILRAEVGSAVGTERFLREIRVTARLDHPHILTLIDSGEDEGFLWYVLPYVRGESLRARLTREQQFTIDEALNISRQVASALEYAHRQGVIHRDVKPENVLLHEGEAIVVDFGIALAPREAAGERLTASGFPVGTPQYMSPEQATGSRHVDARADIYALAAVLYEMLAGEPPFTGPNVQTVIAKLVTEEPLRLRTLRDSVPPGVDHAVARALAKVPADRFTSIGDFVRAFEAPVPRPREERLRSPQKTSGPRRSLPRPVFWIALGASLAAGAGSWAYDAYSESRDVQAERRAVAMELFYEIKALEKRELTAVDSAAALHASRARRIGLERMYRSQLELLGVYGDRTPEKVQAIYRMIRRFGESEVNAPSSFIDGVLRSVDRWGRETRLDEAIVRALDNGYAPRVAAIMREHGLPPEFLYLALYTSSLKTEAVGVKTPSGHAKGLWQLQTAAARQYGLKVGPLEARPVPDALDERHDFEKATRAAARYLRSLCLGDAQGSGLLAIAAYEWGQGDAHRGSPSMRRRQRDPIPLIRSLPPNSRERTYWTLMTRLSEQISLETRYAVLDVVAAAVIGENPQLFGFGFEPLLGSSTDDGGGRPDPS